MPILYNCRHSGDQYRITKFDEDMNVESSYLCTESECECPAGQRPTCRHRQMVPRFIQRKHIGDEWFFDYDRGGWVQMGPEWNEPAPELTGLQEEQILMGFHQPAPDYGTSPSAEAIPLLVEANNITATEIAEREAALTGPTTEAIIGPLIDATLEAIEHLPAPEPAPRPKKVFIRRRI